ncbi:hypothetical protein CU072_03795 [Bacillus thuringiensis]|nr:hypothetical protein CU072_03795 [Bacillus thuringiensis]
MKKYRLKTVFFSLRMRFLYLHNIKFIDQKVINTYHLIMLNINLHNIIEVMKKLQKISLK